MSRDDYRNAAHAQMVERADWHAKFIAAYCVVIHERVQAIAEKQWAKDPIKWGMDPVVLARSMAREVQLEEPVNVEPHDTLGILAG